VKKSWVILRWFIAAVCFLAEQRFPFRG
jgi:hypothetical protein